MDSLTDPERSRIDDPAGSWVRTQPPGPWALLARCRGESTERWVAPATRQEVDGAIAVCQRCGVRIACAVYARDAGCSGVWGGALLVEGVPRQWRRPRPE